MYLVLLFEIVTYALEMVFRETYIFLVLLDNCYNQIGRDFFFRGRKFKAIIAAFILSKQTCFWLIFD